MSSTLRPRGQQPTISSLTLVTPWTVACPTPLSVGFSRQEYWSGLPFPSPGDLADPGIKPGSPALQADSLPTAYHFLLQEIFPTQGLNPSLLHFLHWHADSFTNVPPLASVLYLQPDSNCFTLKFILVIKKNIQTFEVLFFSSYKILEILCKYLITCSSIYKQKSGLRRNESWVIVKVNTSSWVCIFSRNQKYRENQRCTQKISCSILLELSLSLTLHISFHISKTMKVL